MKRLLEKTNRVNITIGKHENLSGYFARVGSCETSWGLAGHGWTPEEAIEEVIEIKLGSLKKSQYESNDFRSFLDIVKRVAKDDYRENVPVDYKMVFEAEYKYLPSPDEIWYFLDCHNCEGCVVCAEQMGDSYFIWVYQL